MISLKQSTIKAEKEKQIMSLFDSVQKKKCVLWSKSLFRNEYISAEHEGAANTSHKWMDGTRQSSIPNNALFSAEDIEEI